MKYNKEKIGKRIEICRKALRNSERPSRKVNQEELGDMIGGYSRKAVASWEHGDTLPPLDAMLKMCEIFECDLDYLLGAIECKTKKVADIADQIPLKEDAILMLIRLKQMINNNEELISISAETGQARADATFLAGFLDWFICGLTWKVGNSSILETIDNLKRQLIWHKESEHMWDSYAIKMNSLIEQNARYEMGEIFSLLTQEYIQDYINKQYSEEV